jgi:hypothetical protein
MGYDLMPDVTAREKERIIKRALHEGGMIVFEHDPDIAACTLQLDTRGRAIVKDAVEAI